MKRYLTFFELTLELALALALSLSSNCLYGQVWPKLSWYQTYNDPVNGYDIVKDVKFYNGNIYLAGISSGADSSLDLFILEYSDQGDSLLGIRFNADYHSVDQAASIAVDSHENIYVVGSSTFDQDSNYAILQKYSSTENLIFAKYFNSDKTITSEGNFITLDSNEEPVIGYTQYNMGQSAKVAKYSSSGDSIWTLTIADDTSMFTINYLLTDQADNIYAALTQSFRPGSHIFTVKTVIIKISNQGQVIWQTPVAGDSPHKIILDKDQNIILITENDGRTIKFDHDGNVLWTNDYKNSKYPIISLTGLVIDSDNNIIVSGYIFDSSGTANYRTKKLSPDGTEIWSNDFESMEGLNDLAMDLAIDNGDNLYVTGSSHYPSAMGVCYTVTYTKDGEPGWVFRFDLPNTIFELPVHLFIGDSNFVYIGGYAGYSDFFPNFFAFKIDYGYGNDVKQIDNDIPGKFYLSQNYPNPFNPLTKVDFTIPKGDDVKLEVYNVLGKLVDVLINKYLPAGSYSADFNASKLSSGVYFYKLTSGSFVQMKKAVLLK